MKQTDSNPLADPPEQPPEARPLPDEALEGATGGVRMPPYECPHCGWSGHPIPYAKSCPGCGHPL